MKKVAIVLALLLCTGVVFAGENHSCDTAKHASDKTCDMQKGKTTSLTGQIVTKDDGRYFRVANSEKEYPICEHSTASLDKVSDKVDVKVTAKVIDCDDHKGQATLFISKADKI